MTATHGTRVAPVTRITLGARVFALAVLAAPVLWYRDRPALLALLAVAAVWLLATLAERFWHRPRRTALVEAALIGAVCGVALAESPGVLLAMVVPPFTNAALLGLRRGVVALSAELALVVAVALLVGGGLGADQGLSVITWAVGGLGLAFIGNFVHSSLTRRPADRLTPYLDAQQLIRRLLDISGELGSGLDVTALAGSVASEVRDELPTEAVAVYVPREGELVPLLSKVDEDRGLGDAEALAAEAWARSEPIVAESSLAFPLGDGAVVGGRLSSGAGLAGTEVERRILHLLEDLRPLAVQLDTALLFSEFREAATADVRRRLAREMHDGVAQDIASLGYIVDALASRPVDEKQAKQLTLLRERITAVVAEVRQSVLTLRTSVGEAESLGTAIGTLARHLSESSRIPIQLTLDEHPTRLQSSVEAELFRIAQEAMNNAIKHSGCSVIEVTCRVVAPDALITVSDDGRGMVRPARADSHGLAIMRERARLVGAELSVTDRPGGGVLVSVQLGARVAPGAGTSGPATVSA